MRPTTPWGRLSQPDTPTVGEVVGLEEMDDRLWHLHFGPIFLGIIDGRGRTLKLIPAARP